MANTAVKATLNPALKEFWKAQARNRVLIGGRASSKCLALGTQVIMHDGSLKAVEDVAVGDKVMGADGSPRTVLHTTTGSSLMMKVRQEKGMDYVVNSDHILSLKSNGRVVNVNVLDYLSWSWEKKQRYKGYNKNGKLSKVKVVSEGWGDYAGFSIDGDHLFCLEDGTVTHNSWDAAGFAIFLANTYNVRFLCARQIQSKIEESVYTLLKTQIYRFGLQKNFDILKNKIVNKKTGSEFIFYGLWRHIEEIKSLEGIDVCWIEEAHSLTRTQWEILEPTIRKENSQFWLLFNPDLVTDFVYQHFVVNTPPDTIVRHINYDENPFLSDTILKVIEAKKKQDYEDYEYVYLGLPKTDDDMAIIKRSWINAAVDAHLKLGFKAEGTRVVGYDVADAGEDTNATAYKHGSVLLGIDEWRGKEDEMQKSSARAYGTAQGKGAKIIYDSIGVGAGVGSNIAQLNRDASNLHSPNIEYAKFAASGAVIKPKKEYEHGVLNKDMFANLKAQAWWSLANRLRNTYNAVQDGAKFDPSEMISISSDIENLEAIKSQLSTPRQDRDNAGKVKVESKQDLKKRGVASPNLADAIVMAFSEKLVGFRTKNSYGGAGSRTF